jgi:hypothetical protein
VLSVACKGSCGTVAPNPMDVAVVADRTSSMSDTDLAAMKTGIDGMLAQMTPSQQYVALGTLGRASVASTPASEPGTACPSTPSTDSSGTTGAWIPVPFSNNYLDADGTATNPSSGLVKAVTCLGKSSTGTSLAAPMKAAARYLLGETGSPNNLSSLPVRTDPVTKVLIFETDGEPNEKPPSGGNPSLTDPGGIFSNSAHYTDSAPVTVGPVPSGPANTTQNRNTSNPAQTWTDTYKTTTNTTTTTTTRTTDGGQTACANFGTVAANARARSIKVITIAYNLGGGTMCGGSNVNPSLPANTTNNSTVITSITPAGAQITNAQGVKSLNTAYKGAAVINQTVTRTVTAWARGVAPDAQVKDILASAASATSDGTPSAANYDCGTSAGRTSENADGDFFFCAATGTDMAPLFTTALSQVSKGIKLLKMP